MLLSNQTRLLFSFGQKKGLRMIVKDKEYKQEKYPYKF
jgi:hypothetical protein